MENGGTAPGIFNHSTRWR